MGYQLKTVCDMCGAEFPIAMGTLGEIAQQTHVFMLRLARVQEGETNTPIHTLCGDCADKGPAPGTAILSGKDTITFGKKGDGN